MNQAKIKPIGSSPAIAVNDECNQTDFERRLVRLWRCGFLPSKICRILDITASHMSSELDRLSALKVDLSFDSASESSFNRASYLAKVKRLPDNILNQTKVDTLFYYGEGVQPSDIVLLVQRNLVFVNEVLLTGRTPGGQSLLLKTPQQIAARNAAAVSDYIANESLKNVNTLISKKYGISRKMLNIILEDAGYSKRKKREAPARKTDPRIQKIHQQIVNNYIEGERAQEPNLISQLANKHGYSTTHIKNILKKANVL